MSDGGDKDLFLTHQCLSLPPQAVPRLAAARSRHGSDSPPDCHSLPCRHFATPEEEPIITFAATVSLRLGHAPALNVHRTFIHYRRAALLLCNKGRLKHDVNFIIMFKVSRSHVSAPLYGSWRRSRLRGLSREKR